MTDAEKPGNIATLLSPQAQAWLEENKDAIAAHNERIAKHGTLITPIWLEDGLSADASHTNPAWQNLNRIADEIAAKAAARGLTDEILEELMSDIS